MCASDQSLVDQKQFSLATFARATKKLGCVIISSLVLNKKMTVFGGIVSVLSKSILFAVVLSIKQYAYMAFSSLSHFEQYVEVNNIFNSDLQNSQIIELLAFLLIFPWA